MSVLVTADPCVNASAIAPYMLYLVIGFSTPGGKIPGLRIGVLTYAMYQVSVPSPFGNEALAQPLARLEQHAPLQQERPEVLRLALQDRLERRARG